MGPPTDGDELQERAEHAPDKVVDPDRLLPGEEPATTNLDDIDHWLSVYSELLGFKQRLVDTTEQAAAELDHSDAQAEGADTALTLLEREPNRPWSHLPYWPRPT